MKQKTSRKILNTHRPRHRKISVRVSESAAQLKAPAAKPRQPCGGHQRTAAASALTLTMASFVWAMSDMTPSVIMSKTKYWEPSWTAAPYLHKEKRAAILVQVTWYMTPDTNSHLSAGDAHKSTEAEERVSCGSSTLIGVIRDSKSGSRGVSGRAGERESHLVSLAHRCPRRRHCAWIIY